MSSQSKIVKMHTLDARASAEMYVLESDVAALNLTDAQVERAITSAARNEGQLTITVTGTAERYVEIDGIVVPVLGCALVCDECGKQMSQAENRRNAVENEDEDGNSFWCDDCAKKKRAEAEDGE